MEAAGQARNTSKPLGCCISASQQNRPFAVTSHIIAIMTNQTQITVQRMTSYADRLRAYKVKIDGVVVGSVRAGDSATIPVSPGRHSLQLRIDWAGSERIDFAVKAGEQIFFECGSNLAGWRVLMTLFYLILLPRKWLWLRTKT